MDRGKTYRVGKRMAGQTAVPRVLAFGLVVCVFSAAFFVAAPRAEAMTLSQFMDRALFKPHNSPITGAMVINNARWYGVDVLPQLVILAAETSLGDPRLGGELVRRNNFGCLGYRNTPTKWGALANGKVVVAGRTWYTFATPQAGVMALGRYLKIGRGGVLRLALDDPPYDWVAFAKAYYGNYPGLEQYTQKLKYLEAALRAKAARYGVSF